MGLFSPVWRDIMMYVGQARTISTHLKAVQSAKGIPSKNTVKWFYRLSVTCNMVFSQWLSCTHDILLMYFL